MSAGRPHLNTLDNAPSTTINNKGLLKINTEPWLIYNQNHHRKRHTVSQGFDILNSNTIN